MKVEADFNEIYEMMNEKYDEGFCDGKEEGCSLVMKYIESELTLKEFLLMHHIIGEGANLTDGPLRDWHWCRIAKKLNMKVE